MNTEPIKHHYIPQFLFKNFCFDDKGHVYFYDKVSKQISVKSTKDVFMTSRLYEDTINNPDDLMRIEKDFSKYENEASQVIKSFLTASSEITIPNKKAEMLKLFVAIMRLRSNMSSEFFKHELSENSKEFYSKYQPDGNFDDFWKRNLALIISCRSWDEVWKNDRIDLPFQAFMKRDAYGVAGMDFLIVEKRGKTDFVLSDSYPTVIYEQITKENKSFEIPMFDFLPLSPNRMLMFISKSVQLSNKSVTHFDIDFLKPPKKKYETNEVIIKVKKIYENDVNYINSEMIVNNTEGFIFNNKERLGVLLQP